MRANECFVYRFRHRFSEGAADKLFMRQITLRQFPLVFVIALSAVPTQGQITSPGYDPSPVRIESAPNTKPRLINSLDLLTLRDITGLSISPDGKSIAYVVSQAVLETNSHRTTLFVVGTNAGSVPRNLGSAGPPHWDAVGQYEKILPKWSPDSRLITLSIGKRDGKQIWLWNREGGSPKQLTLVEGDVRNYEWSSDGRQIVFEVVEPISNEEIRRFSEKGIRYDSYEGNGFEGSILTWERLPIARATIATKPRPRQVWIYDFAARAQRRATSVEERDFNKASVARPVFNPGDKIYVHIVQPSPDKRLLAYVSLSRDAEEPDAGLWRVTLKQTGEGKTIAESKSSEAVINRLWWSKDSAAVYFLRVDEKPGTRIYRMSAVDGTENQVVKTDDFLTQISPGSNGSLAACVRENPTTPPQVALLDLKDGTLRTLANVNPEFQHFMLGSVDRLEWKNRYGALASGYLVKPLNYEPGKRYPLIVTTYGTRGFLRGAVGDEYPIQVFAANGFMVLDFYAPSPPTPKPGDFKTMMLNWYSPMASLDTAVKMLDEMGLIDPNRTGLTGLSYGAEITNFTISHSNIFQAAAASSSSGRDPNFFFLATAYWHKRFKEWGLGLPDGETAERWKELSPALNAKHINAPLLINVADSELLIDLQYYTSLREHQKAVEMFIYADERHLKIHPKHRYEIYNRNLDWFNLWLRDKEDPDPAKAEQYKRWRELRTMKEENERKRQN